MSGMTDLDAMLEQLAVTRRPGRWTVVTVGSLEQAVALSPQAVVVEDEGVTAVVPVETAHAAGLAHDFEAAWLTLTIHSALEAVGLTAAVSDALAAQEIPCNVLAGAFHDHLLVPFERADEATCILSGLAR